MNAAAPAVRQNPASTTNNRVGPPSTAYITSHYSLPPQGGGHGAWPTKRPSNPFSGHH